MGNHRPRPNEELALCHTKELRRSVPVWGGAKCGTSQKVQTSRRWKRTHLGAMSGRHGMVRGSGGFHSTLIFSPFLSL